jgi:hypothetical protein
VYATTQWLGKPSYLGASTTFVRAAGLLERTVAPNRVAANEYFTKEKVRVDWQFMLVLGIFLGALVSSTMDRSLSWRVFRRHGRSASVHPSGNERRGRFWEASLPWWVHEWPTAVPERDLLRMQSTAFLGVDFMPKCSSMVPIMEYPTGKTT